MGRFLLSCCSVLLFYGCVSAGSQSVLTPEHTRDRDVELVDEAFLAQYSETYGFSLGRPTAMRIMDDDREILFLRSGSRDFTRALYRFDLETGEEEVLLTAEQILEGGEETLSAEALERRERLRLRARGITSFQLSPDASQILVPLSGELFLVNRSTKEVTELSVEAGYPNDPKFSPDGRQIAYVVEGDLYVLNLETGEERRLTHSATEEITNGMPGFIAQEEMRRFSGYWWSPDSTRIAYEQTDISPVERLYSFNPMQPEQPSVESPFPRAGTENAIVRLGCVPVEGGNTLWIDWDRDTYPYLATVRWSQNAPLTLVLQNRSQTELAVMTADSESAVQIYSEYGQDLAPLHFEEDDIWLNIDQQMPRWLEDGSGFFWTTEREGYRQLELRNDDGLLRHVLTSEESGYTGLNRVDESSSTLWFQGGESPIESHVYRLTWDESGTELVERVSQGRGLHHITMGGSDGEIWISSYSPINGEQQQEVTVSGESVGQIDSLAEVAPFLPQPEFVEVGERQFHAVVIRPRDFDSALQYPVIVSVYGGPTAQVVRASATRYRYQQWLADQGFIVVSMDGRGTPGRGRAWERAIWGNFIEVPLGDQVEILQGLGVMYPEMDLGRVGITGWSFGGYMATMAVLLRPDVFHAAIAGAPVTDWLDYDTHYTEHYMGHPEDNEAGYTESSALTYAGELSRPLLIIHGTADDNVYFTHAVKLSDALLRAGIRHDFLPLSGSTHMVSDPAVRQQLSRWTVQFFKSHLSLPE